MGNWNKLWNEWLNKKFLVYVRWDGLVAEKWIRTFKWAYTGSKNMPEFVCCKSSGWLETSQWNYSCCTFSDKACQGTYHTKIQAHTATMEADDHKKHNYYKNLQNTLDEIPRHDYKLLMGDFNVQIDKSRQGMESTIVPHGFASINDNGERFTLFCSLNNFSNGHTFFRYKGIHKTT